MWTGNPAEPITRRTFGLGLLGAAHRLDAQPAEPARVGQVSAGSQAGASVGLDSFRAARSAERRYARYREAGAPRAASQAATLDPATAIDAARKASR